MQADQHELNRDLERAAELCGRASNECVRTIAHCLELGGEHAAKAHQQLLADAADVCSATACLLSRRSESYELMCAACAPVAERCAADCERMTGKDEQMTRCAELCRQVQEICSRLGGEAGAKDATGTGGAVAD